MRLFSSSSLCSLWHRCLCWARKRNTITLKKHGAQHQAMKRNTEAVYICAWDTVHRSEFTSSLLLFAVRSLPPGHFSAPSHSGFSDDTVWALLWNKVLDWKKTKLISSYYNSTFMTLFIQQALSVIGILWAHLHTNTSDAWITGFYLLMVHNTTCPSM